MSSWLHALIMWCHPGVTSRAAVQAWPLSPDGQGLGSARYFCSMLEFEIELYASASHPLKERNTAKASNACLNTCHCVVI
jgi:hypothetical protein